MKKMMSRKKIEKGDISIVRLEGKIWEDVLND
jgi:hypothetical protein